jgi:hypothetical protein
MYRTINVYTAVFLKDKPSGLKHVEDIKIKNWESIILENEHFVVFYCIIPNMSFFLGGGTRKIDFNKLGRTVTF